MCAPDRTTTAQNDSNPPKPVNLDSHNDSEGFGKSKQQQEAPTSLKHAIHLGVSSICLLMMSFSLTMPYMQSKRDELGCDSVCQGSMTSARSALTLVGAAVIGRLSDLPSHRLIPPFLLGLLDVRRACLLMGIAASGVGLVMTNRARTLNDLWLSLLPTLLQQNMHVMKALFSDYFSHFEDRRHTNSTSSTTERASSTGLLGMSTGLAMMIGPIVGSSLLTSYDQTMIFSLLLLVASAILVFLLPSVDKHNERNDRQENRKTLSKGLFSHFDIPSARSPPALFILANRLLSTLAYNMFLVVWPASLRERFQFGPRDYGLYFSFVGLFLALSQGIFSKMILEYFGGETSKGRIRLLVACSLVTCVGRSWAFYTPSLGLVYVLVALFVTAMGVSGTILGADATQIVDRKEAGSFFGILAAVESGAGMAGPLVASTLASAIHPKAPVGATAFLNLAIAVLTFFMYEQFVFECFQRRQHSKLSNKHDKHD